MEPLHKACGSWVPKEGTPQESKHSKGNRKNYRAFSDLVSEITQQCCQRVTREWLKQSHAVSGLRQRDLESASWGCQLIRDHVFEPLKLTEKSRHVLPIGILLLVLPESESDALRELGHFSRSPPLLWSRVSEGGKVAIEL